MKNRLTFLVIVIMGFFFSTQNVISQIQINPGPAVTPEDMVEYLIGPGVNYYDVTFQGADIARGIFNNGSSTNIGLESGIFLTSGAGYLVPGPNMSCSAGINNGMPGHPLLDAICTSTTYNAAVLEFDFIPLNDTVKCRFVFGSEEYSEYANTAFNDVFGFFVSGPDPNTGWYVNKNIAIVPGTTNTAITINNVNNGNASCGTEPTGPCQNCAYYLDNTYGTTIEYDGFTVVITLWVVVVPDELYHFTIGVADAGDGILDSGLLLEGTSFKSLGPPDFLSFNFLVENNPGLSFDINGEVVGNDVYLEVPPGTNLSNLVADFEVRGVEVFVDGALQETGISANDFTMPLTYHLEGYAENDWTIQVDIVSGIEQQKLQSVVVGPNPSVGKINIDNAAGIDVRIFNLLGKAIFEKTNNLNEQSIIINDLPQGIYLIELSKAGFSELRKVIVK